MTASTTPVDRTGLEKALRDLLGSAVRFDEGHLAAYAADASNYRQVPIGVVIPKSLDDVVATMAVCREHAVPVLARGGGTSQNGQCVNVAVVMDLSRHCNRIIEVDPQQRIAVVEPGVVCDSLRDAAERHGLTFGPDPATHSRCTTRRDRLARRAPGRDLRRDRYADEIRARFPRIRRRVSGYSLDQLLPENGFNVARALVGTEGTCATVLQARLRLVRSPAHRVLVVLGYADIYRAADAVPEFERFSPIAIEGLDLAIIDGLRERGLCTEEIALLPKGRGWVVLEKSGTHFKEGSWCAACRENARRRVLEMDAHDIARARGGRCLGDTFVNADTKLRWLCHRGHEWPAPLHRIRKGQWCPECAHMALISNRKSKARRRYEAAGTHGLALGPNVSKGG